MKGHLLDGRFHAILHQCLGKVGESLAKRLLACEGFEVRDFSFHVRRYMARVYFARGMDESGRRELWDELLEDRGPPFGNDRVRGFVDELFEFRSRGKRRSLGGAIDLIASRGDEVVLVEVKSGRSRLTPRQMKALDLARKHGIKTCILRVNFEVRFENAQLYEVNSYHDSLKVSNIPNQTLD